MGAGARIEAQLGQLRPAHFADQAAQPVVRGRGQQPTIVKADELAGRLVAGIAVGIGGKLRAAATSCAGLARPAMKLASRLSIGPGPRRRAGWPLRDQASHCAAGSSKR
jgi:hypothetical protein